MNNQTQLHLDEISLAEAWRKEDYKPVFLREKICEYRQVLHKHFNNGDSVQHLVHQFSNFMDQILTLIWQKTELDKFTNISLIAVGGYGRNELHPYSDVDLLVLLKNDKVRKAEEPISEFITLLWDLGLDVGHSVRSIKQCYVEAKKDITVATNIMEARTLYGDNNLLQEMKIATGPDKIWNSLAFFVAKRNEQSARHKKHNNTEYNLEPDLKEAPGGLRDVQMISWVAKRHFDCNNLHALVEHDFLNEEEYTSLNAAQTFLWELRFILHNICGRGENKLLFDHQKTIAEQLGYKDNEKTLAIEQLMKRYYRTAVEISELNDMLLQHFDESIIHKDIPISIIPINERFQIRNGFIETTKEDVFEKQPSALLEVFALTAKDVGIQGIRIHTVRQIRQFRHLINSEFRKDSTNAALFLELLNAPYAIFSQLKRMKRHGVLGNYIPEFDRIIGQMQYDLFHVYTVDAHTLLLIKNLRRFRYPEQRDSFPIAHNIINNLPKIAPLYIAAIFHDIGKGTGRDHSELGAELVIPFMKRHGYSDWDTELVSWLVKSHLLISITTQRKDLADPQTILDFANTVGNQLRLDYLYVLTVADVNATNSTLWNGWKASLFRELYTKTKQLFRKDLQYLENEELIEERKKDAKTLLMSQIHEGNLLESDVDKHWCSLNDEYFVRHNGIDIAWHTEAILKHQQKYQNSSEPLVLIRQEQNKHIASTQVFTYTRDSQNLFAACVCLFTRLKLSVMDARVMSSKDSSLSLNTYVLIDKLEQNSESEQNQRHDEILTALTTCLRTPEDFPKVVNSVINQRSARQLKHFDIPTKVKISNTENGDHTCVDIKTLDKPGLLALIGSVFMEFKLSIHNARISTLGETVEDIFLVSDGEGKAITNSYLNEKLKQAIEQKLND